MDRAPFAQRRRRDLILAAIIAAGVAALPPFISNVYVQNILVLTLMYAALSQSWNILGGYCGQIGLKLRPGGHASSDEIRTHETQDITDHFVQIYQPPRFFVSPNQVVNALNDVAGAARI